jgi:hypothetical protein
LGRLETAEVLKDANEPMTPKDMVNAMQRKGLWHSDVPRPWATLYFAILREMQKEGNGARFRKVEHGKFKRNR